MIKKPVPKITLFASFFKCRCKQLPRLWTHKLTTQSYLSFKCYLQCLKAIVSCCLVFIHSNVKGCSLGIYIPTLEEKISITFEKVNILERSLGTFYNIYLLVISRSFISYDIVTYFSLLLTDHPQWIYNTMRSLLLHTIWIWNFDQYYWKYELIALAFG